MYKIGQRVKVSMGVNAGKLATVVNKRLIKLDSRGVPDLGRGHYHAMATIDVAIQYDDGTLDVHPRSNLVVVK